QHHRAAAGDLLDEFSGGVAYMEAHTLAGQQLAGERAIAGRRQQQQYPLFVAHGRAGVHAPEATFLPAGRGTPVSTPLNCRNGSPSWMPAEVRVSSRMLRSCAPVRFFSTDMAWRTSPPAS